MGGSNAHKNLVITVQSVRTRCKQKRAQNHIFEIVEDLGIQVRWAGWVGTLL